MSSWSLGSHVVVLATSSSLGGLVLRAIDAERGRSQWLVEQVAVVRCRGLGVAVAGEESAGGAHAGHGHDASPVELGDEVEQHLDGGVLAAVWELDEEMLDELGVLGEAGADLPAVGSEAQLEDAPVLLGRNTGDEALCDERGDGVADGGLAHVKLAGERGDPSADRRCLAEQPQQLHLERAQPVRCRLLLSAHTEGLGHTFQRRSERPVALAGRR